LPKLGVGGRSGLDKPAPAALGVTEAQVVASDPPFVGAETMERASLLDPGFDDRSGVRYPSAEGAA